MNKALTKTDNSFFSEKVMLRNLFLPEDKEINVLELYGGDGLIWDQIIRMNPGKVFRVVSMDVKDLKRKNYLKGDNRKFLPSFNLNNYNVIDIDAYGSPFEQLHHLLINNYKGIIYFTFIMTSYGNMNHKLLYESGITKNMLRKVTTLFTKYPFDIFKSYLGKYGVTEITYINHGRKYYGVIDTINNRRLTHG